MTKISLQKINEYIKNCGSNALSQNFNLYNNANSFFIKSLFSEYDTCNVPYKNNSSYDCHINFEEFADTEEEYNKKIAEIKKFAKANFINLSSLKIPTYNEMELLTSSYMGGDFELFNSFMTNKNTIDDDINLKNIKYKVEKSGNLEVRKYQNGQIVKIYRTEYSAVERIEIFEDTHKIKEIYYNQRTQRPNRMYSYDDKNNYKSAYFDINGKQILNENDKKIDNTVTQLYNEIHQKTSSEKLKKLIASIKEEDLGEILNAYQKKIGKSLIDEVRNCKSQNTFIQNLGFGIKNSDELVYILSEKLTHAYKIGTKIPDFKMFITESLLGYATLEDLYNALLENLNLTCTLYKEDTGGRNLERDIMDSNLDKNIKNKILALFKKDASQLMVKYNPKKQSKNNSIKNEHYVSQFSYDVQYNGSIITIYNKTTKTQSKINMNNMFSSMTEIDKARMKLLFQELPAEFLEVLSNEQHYIRSSNDCDMNIIPENPEWIAGGYYKTAEDRVVTNFDREIIIHEVGHALDNCILSGNRPVYYSDNNVKFKVTFENCMIKYEKAGFIQYSYAKNYSRKDKTSNYCTANEKEMFAECFTLLINGDCQSKEVILKYFKPCLDVVKEMYLKIIKLPPEKRHPMM